MIYCDTSLLVCALTVEPETSRVQAWLEAQEPGQLCVSGWVATEFSSAIARKVRAAELTAEDRANALSSWRRAISENLTLIPVQQSAFDLAARFCEMRDTALRAGDALHLAVASLGGHRLATLDTRMAEAALAVGVEAAGIAP